MSDNKNGLTETNRNKSAEIQKRLHDLQTVAQNFVSLVAHLDMNYESRMIEIQNLERQRDQLKVANDDAQKKANQIITEAQNTSDKNQLEIMRLVDEAKRANLSLEEQRKKALVATQQAEALMVAATEKQKMADQAYQIVEQKRKRIEEAVR